MNSRQTGTQLVAITRAVSTTMDACAISHIERQPIDIEKARRQHQAYCDCLSKLGCEVSMLPAQPDMPDAVFVEDTAIILDELAVITRPGHEPRRMETPSIARALSGYRPLRHIEQSATLDGGDVLLIGHTLYVGRTARSNAAGIAQLREFVTPYGYTVKPARVSGCLHLKSACTAIGPDTLLINRARVSIDDFQGWELIDVHPSEPSAANALLVGSVLLFPKAYPRTLSILERRGYQVTSVDASELAKAEGALTCQSLIFKAVV